MEPAGGPWAMRGPKGWRPLHWRVAEADPFPCDLPPQATGPALITLSSAQLTPGCRLTQSPWGVVTSEGALEAPLDQSLLRA